MLLERQIAIDRDENVELSLGQREQLAVGDADPSARDGCVNLDRAEMLGESAIDTLVEQYLQAASLTARLAARSRKATTCWRVTEGKPRRKSSMVSPASM